MRDHSDVQDRAEGPAGHVGGGVLRPPLTPELLATPGEVREVRREIRVYAAEPCADLELCVSELLTNVIRHLGEGVPVTVRVSRTRDRTRLEVTDPDPRALPVLCRTSDENDESGRGLALLDALSLRWGVDQWPGSKTVWCELPASTPAAECGRHGGTDTTFEHHAGDEKMRAGAVRTELPANVH
ncbi:MULTISPECIES: ATP-binding protein [unclassified Streptomyces]|uniref:ATP-binding protein n=1 Tax=unclassified Streptomyces TaxID=2593676 RepID=UPI0038029B82